MGKAGYHIPLIDHRYRGDNIPSKDSCATDPLDATTWERCSVYRGHLRLALLRCMLDGEMHGLDMIKKIKDVTSGSWNPSPGSVYPVLQEFQNNGIIQGRTEGRSIYYSLTDKGRDAFALLYSEINKHLDFIDWVMEADI